MGRVALQDELEHIDVEPVDPPAPTRRRRLSRRWIAAGLVLVTLAAAITAAPARDALVRAGFRHADRILVTGHALALRHQQLLGVLVSRRDPPDEGRVRRAEARLGAELQDRYAQLRRSLRRDWRLRLDTQTDHFRTAVLRTLEPPVGDPGRAAEAEARARSLRERWRLDRARPETAGLHSVDADVAALQRYVDRPTGVRLVIGTQDSISAFDLDDSRPAPGTSVGSPVVRMLPRGRWIAASDRGRHSWSISEQLSSTVAALGTGVPFPSYRPQTVFFWEPNLHTVSEIDGRTGDVATGPYRLPVDPSREEYVVAGVAASGIAMVRNGGRGPTQVWEPVHDRIVRELPGPAVAVAGDRVAWVDTGPAPMTRVTDVSTGEHLAAVPTWGDVAAFSPDEELLALGHPRGLVIVDVSSGRVDHVPITQLATAPTWDPSGRFLFFQSGTVGGWDTVRHEPFTVRLPDLPPGWTLLAALAG